MEHISTTEHMKSWMSTVPDNNSIAHMTIPGTHNSCATTGATSRLAIFDDFVACQEAKAFIHEQLDRGIRFLDIGCSVKDGDFAVFAGRHDLGMSFHEVIKQCIRFLDQNKTETIIMYIKQKGSSVKPHEFIKLFEQQYSIYLNRMYLKSAVPTLGEVRGKIIVLSSVTGFSGMSGDAVVVKKLDKDVNQEHRFNKLYSIIVETIISKDKKALHITYTNNPGLLVTPKSNADLVNPPLISQFRDAAFGMRLNEAHNESAHAGIIVMDFYPHNLSEIIKHNDNKNIIEKPIVRLLDKKNNVRIFPTTALTRQHADKLRIVRGGNHQYGNYWVKVPVSEKEFAFFNTFFKEFLCDLSNYDSGHAGHISTWIPGSLPDTALWELIATEGAYQIKNAHLNAYMKTYETPESAHLTGQSYLAECDKKAADSLWILEETK